MQIGTVLVIILFTFLAVQSETVILHANQDVLFRKNYPSTNYDGYPEGLEFGAKGSSSGQYRNLINWDLSAIPSNAMVTSARFIITIGKKVCVGSNCLSDDELDLFRVTAEWEESAATWVRRLPGASWTKPGSDYDPNLAGSVHISSTNKYQIDLTRLVQGWVDGTFPQYGVMGEARNYDNTTVWVGGAHDGAWYPACQLIVSFELSTSIEVEGDPVLIGDPLIAGSTETVQGVRNVLGGTFTPGGWKVNTASDKIIYNLNSPIQEFEAEFAVTGIKKSGVSYSLKMPIFNIRDKASNGDYGTAPQNNYVDLWIRTDRWALKTIVRVTGMHEWRETTGPGLSWNPNQVYHIKLTYRNKVLRVYRDGHLQITENMSGYSGNLNADQVFLGRHNRGGYNAPVDAIFSNLRLSEGSITRASDFIDKEASRTQHRAGLQKIYDIHGRIVQTGNTGSLRLPAGIYLIRLSDSKRPCYKKILILH